MVRYCHFWNFGGIVWLIMFGMLALEHSWSVFFLWSWCNLGNVGGFWNFDNVVMLLDELWFGFWEYWHCENFVFDLYECVHDVCGNLWACVNFVWWTWKNFVGMSWIYLWVLANLVGIVEIFFWVCDTLFVPKVVGIFSWTCRNFLFSWLWKNLVVVWIYDKFGSGDILVVHWFDFVVVGYWLGEYIYIYIYLGMEIFGYMFWVMEIAKLNFYVAEPQESRESPNVEKCMGNIVSLHRKCHQRSGLWHLLRSFVKSWDIWV